MPRSRGVLMARRKTPKYTPQEKRRLADAKAANPTASWQAIRTAYNEGIADRDRRRTASALRKKWKDICGDKEPSDGERRTGSETPLPEHQDLSESEKHEELKSIVSSH